MTQKSEFLFPRGRELKFGVSTDALDPNRQKVKPKPAPGVIKTDEEDELYVFRKGAAISFYDLGMRLRSVPTSTPFNGLRVYEWPNSSATQEPDDANSSEYVELAFEVDGTLIEHGGIVDPPWYHEVVITDEDWETLTAKLLGSRKPLAEDEEPSDVTDPLGFSVVNGGTRRLPHCAEIWSDQVYYQPILFHISGRDIAFTLNPDVFTEEDGIENPYLLRESKVEDAEERWNPNNITEGAAFHLLIAPKGLFDGCSGDIKVDDTFPHYNVVPNIAHYHGFDTADTVKYKITNEPYYEADAVTYSFQGKDNRFYLRPRLMGMVLFSGTPAGGHLVTGDWVGRPMPIYPRVHGFDESTNGIKGMYRCLTVRSLYSNHAGLVSPNSFVAAIHMNVDEFYNTAQDCLALRQGSLAGIIGQGNQTFYIWANQDIRDNQGNDYGVIVSNAVVLGTCSY